MDSKKTIKRKISLTHHASMRLNTRCTLTEEELLDILVHKKTVIVPSKPNSSNIHHLFYSKKDDDFLVAVLNKQENELITLLLLEYQEQTIGPLSDKTLRKATYKNAPIVHKEKYHVPNTAPSHPRRYDLSLILHVPMDSLQSLSLPSFQFSQEPRTAEAALENRQFRKFLLKQLQEKEVPLANIDKLHLIQQGTNKEIVLTLTWANLDKVLGA